MRKAADKTKHDLNATAFLGCVGPLLESREVNSMKQWRHHFSITCYQHSLFVSYMAFRLARYFGWDYRAAARAGLLHDLYLYDPWDASAHPGNQCLDHPEFALRNAAALCPDLSDKEKNAIVSHMFPLAVHLPRCRDGAGGEPGGQNLRHHRGGPPLPDPAGAALAAPARRLRAVFDIFTAFSCFSPPSFVIML